MITPAEIVFYDGFNLTVRPTEKLTQELQQKSITKCELRLVDSRVISPEQRRKLYAIIREISLWNGDDPEWLKQYFKFSYCMERDISFFSLSNCEKSLATDFINYLIDFCLYQGIPTRDTLLNLTDDISKYLYACLANRKCAVCNMPGEVHHVDRVGMGRDREQIVHVGLRAICLCRLHHTRAHENENKFFKDNHVYGITLDENLCNILNLNTKEK